MTCSLTLMVKIALIRKHSFLVPITHPSKKSTSLRKKGPTSDHLWGLETRHTQLLRYAFQAADCVHYHLQCYH